MFIFLLVSTIELPWVVVQKALTRKTNWSTFRHFPNAQTNTVVPNRKTSVVPRKLHAREDLLLQLGMKMEQSGYHFDVNGSETGKAFKPLIQTLRLFGHCPLSCDTQTVFEKTPDSAIRNEPPLGGISYKFQWDSWWTLWSVLWALLYFSMWAIVPIELMTDFRLCSNDG